MLSRQLGLTLSRNFVRRNHFSARNLSTGIALTTAGVVAWNLPFKTNLEASPHTQQQQQHVPLYSLVIPTLEATIRAQRLVWTAVEIVWIYESAKLRAKLGFEPLSKEQQHWLAEKAKRQEELSEAQRIYTDESYSSDLDPSEYRTIKLEQRQSVLSAAERLAEVQEVIDEIGGNEVHFRAANKLLKLCQTNGGVYIKIGQHLVRRRFGVVRSCISLSSHANAYPSFAGKPRLSHSTRVH